MFFHAKNLLLLPESVFQHAQKVRDIRLSVEIHGKCEKVHAAIPYNDSREFK